MSWRRVLLLATLLAVACTSRRHAAAGLDGDIPRCSDLFPGSGANRGAQADHGADSPRVGLFRNAAWLYLRAYKLGVSPADGDRCGLYPSCSAYTEGAVRLYGPVRGGWLGASRQLADHRDPELPRCSDGGRLLRVDLPDGAWPL